MNEESESPKGVSRPAEALAIRVHLKLLAKAVEALATSGAVPEELMKRLKQEVGRVAR